MCVEVTTDVAAQRIEKKIDIDVPNEKFARVVTTGRR
jgi:hypothetical protein